MLYGLLSFLPIVVLLVVSLLRGVKTGIYVGLLVTSVLFFIWGSPWLAFPASFVAAFIDTLSILMIVFGALLLYEAMDQHGLIAGIKASLQGLHPQHSFQFYFLALFLTAFFESVAGFGTPGAIVPLLLVSMGFQPVQSIATVLLIDGLFAVTGAVGTPVTAGFASIVDLAPDQLNEVYLLASILVACGGLILLMFIQHFMYHEAGIGKGSSWKLYMCLMLPFVALAYVLEELTGVVAAVIMGATAYLFFFTNRQMDARPWLPYGLLVVVLLLPKLFAPLAAFISWEWHFGEILGTDASASLQPLRSPLIPFVLSSILAVYLAKGRSIDLNPVWQKTRGIALILFPSLAITQLMLASGDTLPSMVDSMALLFAGSGALFPLISPFVGALGTFITGSTTVSNIIFGSVQFETAEALGLPNRMVLSLQLAGASIGNAICLFNIIAAAGVVGLTDYRAILRKNLLPVVFATLMMAIGGWMVIYFFS